MQAAEGSFNKKYFHEPNGIKDPEYSIECGVQELKAALVSAEVENPVDMERIKLALQGYNFGNGYISWAKTNYGSYSYANAVEFSAMQAQRLGWEKYGDTQYPTHVLRYYPYGRALTSGGNQVIVEVALTQLGNGGGQPYWSWYGFGGRVEWCACFTSWCVDQCGYLESGIIPNVSLCLDGVNWFKGKRQWQDKNYEPQAGDLIFFDWGIDGSIDHLGIVEKCEIHRGGQLWRRLQTAELSSRERLNLRLWMPCLLMAEWVKEKPEVNPLAALLPYIRRLRLLQEWTNPCRSIYPEAHPCVSVRHF